MIIKISNGRPGQVVFESDNGNVVSILWSYGSYSDNHDMFKFKTPDGHPDYNKQDWESTTVEVYSMGRVESKFTAYLERKYKSGNPAVYVPVDDIAQILRKLDNE